MENFTHRPVVLLWLGLAALAASPTARAQFVTCNGSNSGAACLVSGSCQTGLCAGATCVGDAGDAPAGTVCLAPSGQCDNGAVCTGSSTVCPPDASKPNGTACNDGNACTQADTCQSGTCVGGFPVTCTPSDQCHVAGTCNPTTGACSNPNKPNGASCDDGNACTQDDTCQSGTCGGFPVTCAPSDQCHVAGTCNPATGACSNPVSPNGTACNDGNACTQADTCQSGTCVGGIAVTCTASDQCHVAGACDPATGACSNPAAPNGTACNDGNPSTVDDVCTNEVCSGIEFHIISSTYSGLKFSVTFSTVAGHQYSLDGSPDLVAWTAVGDSAFTGDGNPHTSTVQFETPPSDYFLRVDVGP